MPLNTGFPFTMIGGSQLLPGSTYMLQVEHTQDHTRCACVEVWGEYHRCGNDKFSVAFTTFGYAGLNAQTDKDVFMSTQTNSIKYRGIASVIKGVLVIHARPFAPRVGLHRFTVHTSTVARVVVFIPALLLARVSGR